MLHYIRNYSLDISALTAILFVILYHTLPKQPLLFFTAVLLLLFVFFLLFSMTHRGAGLRAFRKTATLSLLAALLAFGCCYRVSHQNSVVLPYQNSEQSISIVGYVTDNYSSGLFGKSIVKVTQLDGKECDISLSLYRTNLNPPSPYTRFEGTIVFNLPDDKETVSADRNIAACAELISIDCIQDKVRTPEAILWRVSEHISNRLHQYLNADTAALSDALLLGNRSGLSDHLVRDFKTLGVSHLLAISGLHLSILTAGIWFLLGKLRSPLALRVWITTALILLYMGLCGFTPSILRAGLMAACLLFYQGLGQTKNGLRALLYSSAFILLLQPYLCRSISLQLSVFATLGILLIFPYLFPKAKKKSGFIRPLLRFVAAQFCIFLSATLFTLPITFYWFGSFSLLGALGTLILVPLVTLLMYLLPMLLMSLFCAPIATLLSFTIEFLSKSICNLAGFARYGKDLYCPIPIAIPILLAVVILIIPILYRFRFRYKRALPIALCCVILALAYPYSVSKTERLYYRYDASRETILYEAQNEVTLIETGNASLQNAYTALREAQYTLGQTGIDNLVLTHYHNADISFVRYLCQNTYLDIVYLPKPQNETEQALRQEIGTICRAQQIELRTYDVNSELALCNATLSIHSELLERSDHPAQAIALKQNQSSVLLADPAVFELDGLGAIDLSGVDALVFLSSPPIDKYPLPNFPEKEGVFALYANEEQFSLLQATFAQYHVLSQEKPYLFFCFDN